MKEFCTVQDYKEYIGIATNNVAEYSALLKAVDLVRVNSVHSVIFHSDSELMVKQVNGIYKVKNEQLKVLNEQVLEKLERRLKGRWKLEYVPREENKEADKLANEAIDEWVKSGNEIGTGNDESYELNFK